MLLNVKAVAESKIESMRKIRRKKILEEEYCCIRNKNKSTSKSNWFYHKISSIYSLSLRCHHLAIIHRYEVFGCKQNL